MIRQILKNKYLLIILLIVLMLIMIISPQLVVILLIVVVAYVLISKFKLLMRWRDRSEKKITKIVTKVLDFELLESKKMLINYGIGNVIAKLGDYWVLAIQLGELDQEVINQLVRLNCRIVISKSEILILIVSSDVDEVLTNYNIVTSLLNVKNISFRQLNPRDTIYEVFRLWGII